MIYRTLFIALVVIGATIKKYSDDYDFYKAVECNGGYHTAVIFFYPKYEHMHIHSHNAAYSQLQNVNDNASVNHR